MAEYLAGLALGLALIMPIGAQNVFIVNQGLTVGIPRALIAVGIAGVCDSIMIVVGWKGMATVLERSALTQGVLLVAGVAFLLWFGFRALTASVEQQGQPLINGSTQAPGQVFGPGARIARDTAAVSLLNPHAMLDTVGVIGAAIAAQEVTARSAFAGGALTASWVWFLVLAVGAAAMRRHLSGEVRRRVERLSGVLMLGLAALFARDFLEMFH